MAMMRLHGTLCAACVALAACAPSNGGAGTRVTTGTGGANSASGGSGSMATGGSGTGGVTSSTGGAAMTTATGGATPVGTGGDTATGSGGMASATGGATGSGGTPGTGGAAGAGMPGNTDAGADGSVDPHPLIAILGQFAAADVPVRGPQESPPTPRGWTPPATVPTRPGNGIAQHPLLYVGENYNRITLTNEGKVIWTYDTAPGFELDDIWMLSNGHILYTHMSFIEELTPKKQVVWHMNAPTGSEIHSCQPIGLDKVLVVENGTPPKAVIINKTTGTVESEHVIPNATAGVHGQFRRIRMTASGNYLLAYLDGGKVVEYDKTLTNVVWSFTTPRPWSAVRLHNGNTLIQDESQSTAKEVNPQGQVVWQLAKTDIAFPAGTATGNTQTSERLSSGNTVMFTHGVGVNIIQAVEVTPDKKVVWMLQDWIHFGDATAAQFLDEPGIPEVPGDTEH